MLYSVNHNASRTVCFIKLLAINYSNLQNGINLNYRLFTTATSQDYSRKTADYQRLLISQHFQAKNMPRYQKKKIRAAMVQTQVPTGFNMKRRTSSTITQDEAILLGE